LTQPSPKPLSSDDARQLAEHLAVLAQSGLPLAPALFAAAEEIPNVRLASGMKMLAEQLQAGATLDDVLAKNPRFLPPHLQQLIVTAARSGNLPEVLMQVVEIDRQSADLRRSMRMALAYPMLLLVLWVALFVLLAWWVVPPLTQIYRDFKTDLPLTTMLVVSMTGEGMMRIVAFIVAAVSMLVIGLRVSLRPQGWQRMLTEVPLVGPTLLWRGVSNWCRLLALLLRQGLPLPEAAKLAASGVDVPLMTMVGFRVSRTVESGRKLADSLEAIRTVPPTLVPLVRWGEDHGALPESLDSAAEMFETRIRMRAALVESILPPIVFVVIGLGTFSLATAIMLPLVNLIRDLSGMRWRAGGSSASWSDPEIGAAVFVGVLILIWFAMAVLFWSRRSALGATLTQLIGVSNWRESTAWTIVRAIFNVAFWILFFLILLIVMFVMALGWGILLWLATLVIALMIAIRYREMERRALVSLLATAVQKGIPLPAAVRAFADERYDGLGRRARNLGVSLEQAARLDVALQSSGIALPCDALVAVRTGSDRGALGPLLEGAAKQAARLDAPIHAAVGRTIYLAMFIVIASVVTFFVALRIVPAYIKIFQDFRTPLPPATSALVKFFVGAGQVPFVAIASAILFIFLAYTLARYTGLTHWEPPILRRFTRPLDSATMLRTLAQAVEANLPMDKCVASLARHYPKRYLRSRLRYASSQIDDGANWCDALVRSGLLGKTEAAVITSAERLGNLAWALREMADRLERRFTNRLTGLLAVGFPAVLIFFGLVVLFISVGMIYPLAHLILRLS
jgi:type II secretory pathway component PulF